MVFAEGRRPLDVSDLPQAVRNAKREDARTVTLPVGSSLAEVEKRFIEETLRSVLYDKPRAAETLGIAEEHLVPYGHFKAKVDIGYLTSLADRPLGKLLPHFALIVGLQAFTGDKP